MRRDLLLAGVLTLAACDNGMVSFGGGDGAPVNAQIAHRNGVVLQVLSVRRSGERALVSVRVMNGREREIDLNAGTDHSYIVTDGARNCCW